MQQAPHHRHAPNPYASGPLDRADHLRENATAIADAMASSQARLVPVWRGRNLVRFGATIEEFMPSPAELAVTVTISDPIFLGLDRDRMPYFALDLSDRDKPPEIAAGCGFEDLRKVGPALPSAVSAIMAYARGVIHWHQRHLYCGVCGAPTRIAKAGHERHCCNLSCNMAHFPRTDPAVIMLVHDGGDRVLLGRQPNWRPGMHSVLAGFVEPGESLEDAVAREVQEEVGIRVTDIDYRHSQPWPFPSSIMVGFFARALETDLDVNVTEIESAQWVDRARIANSPEDDRFHLPSRDSIARRLLHDWLGKL